MNQSRGDERWMAAAIALSTRGRGRTCPNPNIGCVIVRNGHMVGRGWTQPTGRPHAEAVALAQAGDAAHGATAYVTLEPCAHNSSRGAPCADSLITAGIARVVGALRDPDQRTNGRGFARLAAAGIAVTEGVLADAARHSMAGWWSRATQGRAHVTLKLATSLDGCIALTDGSSRWITGEAARRHAHLLRAQSDAILVGRGTWDVDRPSLDIRLAGLEDRGPRRLVLSRYPVNGIEIVASPAATVVVPGVDALLVEGGAQAAAAFLHADLVDRLILYRAPILIGSGKASLADIGLHSLADAHGRWRLADARQLGPDRVEIYHRTGQEG
jgi:diaminohydroxyphosphoribosylaminopyrimidine deaminase/5-amino-6-(5-phosphoribosylamino)uracil reductase